MEEAADKRFLQRWKAFYGGFVQQNVAIVCYNIVVVKNCIIELFILYSECHKWKIIGWHGGSVQPNCVINFVLFKGYVVCEFLFCFLL